MLELLYEPVVQAPLRPCLVTIKAYRGDCKAPRHFEILIYAGVSLLTDRRSRAQGASHYRENRHGKSGAAPGRNEPGTGKQAPGKHRKPSAKARAGDGVAAERRNRAGMGGALLKYLLSARISAL